MPSKNASMPAADQTGTAEKKFFTVAEANRALPYVSRVVGDLSEEYHRLVDLRDRLEQAEDEDAANEREAEYNRTMDRLSELVDELHGAGAELKDFEKGLVDFPAWYQGREILLCWHKGEEQVSYWHEIDAGFAGRQSVESLDRAVLEEEA